MNPLYTVTRGSYTSPISHSRPGVGGRLVIISLEQGILSIYSLNHSFQSISAVQMICCSLVVMLGEALMSAFRAIHVGPQLWAQLQGHYSYRFPCWKKIVKNFIMWALWLGLPLLIKIVKKNVASERRTISIPTLFSIFLLISIMLDTIFHFKDGGLKNSTNSPFSLKKKWKQQEVALQVWIL